MSVSVIFWHSVSHQLQPKNCFQPRLDVAQQQAEKAQRAKLQVEEVGYGWSLISRDLFGKNTTFFLGGGGRGPGINARGRILFFFCWVNRFKLVYVLSSKNIRKDFTWILNVTKTIAPSLSMHILQSWTIRILTVITPPSDLILQGLA